MAETAQQIKDRLKVRASRIWEARGLDMDLVGFDPLVELLLGACAHEFEKVSKEIDVSRKRIFDRLIELLTPEALTGPLPAHAIMTTKIEEAVDKTNPKEDIFTFKKNDKDLFFSPILQMPLIKAEVKYITSGEYLYQITQDKLKEPFIEAKYGQSFSSSSFWIGVDIDNKSIGKSPLLFFFDWKDELDRQDFIQILSFSKWYVQGQEIPHKPGLLDTNDTSILDQDTDILGFLNSYRSLEEKIIEFYKPYFISVDISTLVTEKSHEIKTQYPDHFKLIFDEKELDKIKDDLLWIRIEFPIANKDITKKIECHLNCFPIINRKLIEKEEKVKASTHVISLPMDTEDLFLDISQIKGSDNTSYHSIQNHNFKNQGNGVYVLRKGGVKRFSKNNASQTLQNLLEIAKDERQVFAALGYNNLESDLSELDILIKRFYKDRQKTENFDQTPFIFYQPIEGERSLSIHFWITNGIKANLIPYGSEMKLYSGTGYKRGSLYLLTRTKGGRNPLAGIESLNIYKEAIMTRGRVVTPEDIKVVCKNKIGEQKVEKIEVKKGVEIGGGSNQGLIQTMDVTIYPQSYDKNQEEEWQEKCLELKIYLEQKSNSLYPFKVKLSHS